MNKQKFIKIAIAAGVLALFAGGIFAANVTIPKVGIEVTPAKSPKDVAATIQILLLLSILTLAPG